MICKGYSYGIHVETRGYSLSKGERRGERGEGATSFFDLTFSLLPCSYLLTFLSFINLKMISSLDVLQFMIHYNIITRNK